MTTYYIRVFECDFQGAFNSNIKSKYDMLHSYPDGDATVVKVLNLNEDANDLYYYTSLAAKRSPPDQTTPQYYSQSGGLLTWDDRYLDDGAGSGFATANWVSEGWTSPQIDLDTFKQELCQFFEDAKDAGYGEDHGTNNLYIFKYKYTNEPDTGWAWYVVYMKGNDPFKQETKVAT